MIIFPIVLLTKRVKRVSRQLQTNQEKFASLLIDFLAGIQTVKIFSMEPFSLRKYQEQNERMAVLEEEGRQIRIVGTPYFAYDYYDLPGCHRYFWPLRFYR